MFQTVNSHKRKVWIYRPCHPVNLSVFTLCPFIKYTGLPGYFTIVVKNPPANVGDKRRGCDSWVRKIPWRRKWQPTPVFLPGKSHEQRSLAGYSPWGCTESDTTEATWHTHEYTSMKYLMLSKGDSII